MLALKNVSKAYGKTRVLEGASFDVRPKDCVCVIGEGGSGKSTIVKLLSRAEDPSSGIVIVDGIDLKAVPPAILQLYRRRLGIAHQEPMLLMHATVAENIALPLELFNVPESIIKRMTDDLMKRLNLTEKANRLAADLSQSEKSLVGIARAIIASPMIMLLDEPLQHLDSAQGKIVIELLKNMHKHGTTLVLFSRSAEIAKAFGARSVQLKDGAITVKAAETTIPASKASSTHRILEETENRIYSVMQTDAPEETKTAAPKKAPPKQSRKQPHEDSVQESPKPGSKGGKKIRITSIGSDL